MSKAIRPTVILATCCLSLFLVTMDITIVNLALPVLGRDLRASVSGLQWSIDGYTIVIASFLVVSGSLGDRFGRRRVFQIGLVTFAIGSLLCSFATSIELLVAFRIVQALGGSMLNPVAMSIIVNVFTEPRSRAQAIGVWGSVVGISMAVGPLLGGFLVQTVGWRAIFWINVPVCVLAIVLTRIFIAESHADRPRRLDPVGQTLFVVGLATLTFCLIEGGESGWQSTSILAGFAVALSAFVGLVIYERRRFEPLIDLRFFRSIPFSMAAILAVLAFVMFNGGLFLSSLYLQSTRGLSPLDAGLCFMPIAAGLIVFSPISGRLVGTGRTRWALIAAGVTLALGALLLVDLQIDTPIARILTAFAFTGAGFGLVNAPITTAAVSGMPRAQAGVAAAIASTSRQVGATLGVAVSGAIVGIAATSPAFALSTRPFWWLVSAGGALIVVLGFVATGVRAQKSMQGISSLFNESS